MHRHVGRIANLWLCGTWRHEKSGPICHSSFLSRHSVWRLLASDGPDTPSGGQRRAQPAHGIPYLTADIFGRPTLIRPAAAPGTNEGTGVRAPGTPQDVAARGRKGRARKIASEQSQRDEFDDQNTHGDSQVSSLDAAPRKRDDAARPAYSPPHEGARHRRSAAERSTWDDTDSANTASGRGPRTQPSPYATPPHDHHPPTKAHPSRAAGAIAAPPSSRPSSHFTSAEHLALSSRERSDRTLTYRLLKASSLRELEQLLTAHTEPPNVIHLAATARQAVLLGSLPRPHETRTLLDKHLLRMAAAGLQRPSQLVQEAQQAAPQGRAAEPAAAGMGREGAHASTGLRSITAYSNERADQASSEGVFAAAQAAFRGGQAVGRGQGRGRASAADSSGAAAAPTGADGAAGVGASGQVVTQMAEAASGGPGAPSGPLVPLREVGDVLWAYGRLRCKPPERVWWTVLRPILLDPAAPQQLASASAQRPEPRSRERRRSTAHDPDGTAVGQDLGKLAVALARMRESDTEVWRVLARAAAAAAPGMSPRALTSILWAFGSVRMTHGSLLAAAVRSIRLDLPHFNSQDLACAMWALARLAAPPPQDADAGGSRAAAAAAAARNLLYGDLSDAVRRRLQLHGCKPAELTTLVGALDEMAQRQQDAERQHHHLQAGLLGSAAAGAPGGGRDGSGGARGSLNASPRLLRVVSQSVRKGLSSLPAGALAEAAGAFQRLGHHDASLYRALAAAMLLRLRHMEPRHLVRAAVALQAAGHTDNAFFDKVLAAAQPNLPSYKTKEVLALVEVCSRLAPACSSSGASPGSGSPVPVPPFAADTAAARAAFLHAAVLHAVSSADAPNGSRRRGGEHEAPAQAGGRAAGLRATGSEAEPMRLRHWHQLLRAAVVGGWRHDDLAHNALDEVLRELRSFRAAWLNVVGTRAFEQVQRQQQRSRQEAALEQQQRQGGERGAVGSSGQMGLGDVAQAESPVYDTTAGDVAGVLYTAALMGQRGRVDLVAAVVAAMLEASRAAAAGAAAAGAAAGRSATEATEFQQAGALALSPAAAEELATGLDFFGPTLDTPAHRMTRAAVQMLRQRLLIVKPQSQGASLQVGPPPAPPQLLARQRDGGS